MHARIEGARYQASTQDEVLARDADAGLAAAEGLSESLKQLEAGEIAGVRAELQAAMTAPGLCARYCTKLAN